MVSAIHFTVGAGTVGAFRDAVSATTLCWGAMGDTVNDVEAAVRTAHRTDYRSATHQAATPGHSGRPGVR